MIKQMIIAGELPPGSRLPPEKELAIRLGLSRGSMREAVKALEMIRVLDVRRGDGTYVTSLEPKLMLQTTSFVADLYSDDSLLEILAVRRTLESHAAGLAAQRVSILDLAMLEDEICQVDGGEDIDALVAHDVRFHGLIARFSGNEYLCRLLDSLVGQTIRARLWRALTQAGAVQNTLAEHRAILDALHERDAALAASASQIHVVNVERWLARLGSGAVGGSGRGARPSRPDRTPIFDSANAEHRCR